MVLIKSRQGSGGNAAGIDPTGFVPRVAEDALARQLLRPHFPADHEILMLAAFDARDRLMRMESASGRGAAHCAVPPRCWRGIAASGATHVVMAHNHPSGIARPSEADRRATREAAQLLAHLGIDLRDHLIFVDTGHFSFRRAGLV